MKKVLGVILGGLLLLPVVSNAADAQKAADNKKPVNVLCLSSILEAISIPDSVRVMSPSPSIVICPLAFSLFVVYVTLGFVTPR